MEIEDQVLSIEQIQELQELGFDVEKYSSMEVNITTSNKRYIVSSSFFKLYPEFGDDDVIERYLTMGIGDMIEVLPEKIKTYSANDEEINFYPRINNTGIIYITTMIDDCIFCSIEGKLINNLFNCLVWCIKNLK